MHESLTSRETRQALNKLAQSNPALYTSFINSDDTAIPKDLVSQNLYSPNQSVARGGDVVVVVKAQVERY